MGYLNSFELKGYITVKTEDILTGEKKVVYDGPNLIVDLGIANIILSLSTIAGGHPVNRIGVGVSSTSVASSDISLEPAGGYLFSTTNQEIGVSNDLVTYTTLVPADTSGIPSGTELREVGLILENDALFARQVIPTVTKTNNIAITIEWRVSCSVD